MALMSAAGPLWTEDTA